MTDRLSSSSPSPHDRRNTQPSTASADGASLVKNDRTFQAVAIQRTLKKITALPFVRSFEQVIPEDTKGIVVHFRQIHEPPMMRNEPKLESAILDLIRPHQAEIEAVLLAAAKSLGVKAIIEEGLGEGTPEMIVRLKQELALDTTGRGWDLIYPTLLATSPSTARCANLAVKHGFTFIRGALTSEQTEELYKKIDATINPPNPKGFWGAIKHLLGITLDRSEEELAQIGAKIHPLREDYALLQAKQSSLSPANSARVGLLVYGGSHDFKRALSDLNSSNPDSPIGLVTLTLNSYPTPEEIARHTQHIAKLAFGDGSF